MWICGGALATAVTLQSILSIPDAFAALGSSALRLRLVTTFGGSVAQNPGAADVPVSFAGLWVAVVVPSLAACALAAWAGSGRRGESRSSTFGRVGRSVGRWLILPGAWEALRLFAFLTDWSSLELFVLATGHLFLAVSVAGIIASILSAVARDEVPLDAGAAGPDSRAPFFVVVTGACAYAVVFTAMNWQLYRCLLVPHGDTVMYEEHLWNLLHGKGFRSYLDQGLFLGEHLQVIHVLLIPLYVLWPSHLLLELCGSVALAAGALPTYWLARRHTQSATAGLWLGLAYLLAAPMQFLDIAIDLKTFRPTSFVIPLMLFALDQMERRRWKTTVVLLAVTLSAQEDLALIVGPLGGWMAFDGWRKGRRTGLESSPALDRTATFMGVGIASFSALYLVLALTVVIPWFRAGAEVHYTTYFGELGSSPGEIVRSMVAKPSLFFGKLLGLRSLKYALLLLLPYGLTSLRSPGRLAVAGPLFAALCLMDTSRDPASQGVEMLLPYHHFHAPLVPILVWSAAAGLGCRRRLSRNWAATAVELPVDGRPDAEFRARFAFGAALATGLFLSLSPCGIAFWDTGSTWYWRRLYVPGKRSEMLPRVLAEIPRSARVASTDFIHPRFTHYERSYDYSQYRRKVSGYELSVPDDTDYVVIDTLHHYSTIKKAANVRELQEEPDRWELKPDVTEGAYIVLRRKK